MPRSSTRSTIRTYAGLLIGLLVSATAGLAHAQEPLLAAVAPGARVMLQVPDPEEAFGNFRPIVSLRGAVLTASADTLVIRADAGGSRVLRVPQAHIRALWVSEGMRPRGQNATRWGMWGLGLGAVAGYAIARQAADGRRGESGRMTKGASLGAMAGLAGGAIVGVSLRTERWRRVQ